MRLSILYTHRLRGDLALLPRLAGAERQRVLQLMLDSAERTDLRVQTRPRPHQHRAAVEQYVDAACHCQRPPPA
ncbi:hypothetical protein HC928_24755 [bacterium]|nr:hypothetical protein [bacterium]